MGHRDLLVTQLYLRAKSQTSALSHAQRPPRQRLRSHGLTGSNRVLVGLSRRFSNFPAAGVDRYELKVPLPENGKGTEWNLFARLLRCGRVGTHAVERRGPVGIALCSTSTAGFPALHLSATFRHGPLVAPGLESAVL